MAKISVSIGHFGSHGDDENAPTITIFPQKTDSDVWSRCIPQFHMHNHACFALGQRWGCKEIKNSVISGNVVILRINHPEYCHEWLVKQPKKCRDNAIGFGTL